MSEVSLPTRSMAVHGGMESYRRKRRLTRLATLSAAAIVISAWATWGCDSFSPRTPEPPGEVQPIVLLTQPDSVYVSLQLGLSSKFINTYINSFDPDFFRFFPDEQDSIGLINDGTGDVFNVIWNRQVEEQVHSSIFGTVSRLELTFGEGQDSSGVGGRDDLIQIRKPYFLVAGDTTLAGIAELNMLRRGGEWRISYWKDVRIDTSWGWLRGKNR